MYDWSNKTALIVDDTEINRLLIQLMLEETHIKLYEAEDSAGFFNLIYTHDFDLILMDINLGEKLNGIDLIKYLRNNKFDVSIIIQSANDYDVKDLNIDGYLRKPIKSKKLLNDINNVFIKKRK